MRFFALCLTLTSPVALFAGDIPVSSMVSAATLYPEGATITREAAFDAPAGEHRLILTDLPESTPLESIRVAVEGATMGSLTLREDYVPPRTDGPGAAIEAAEAEVDRQEIRLSQAQADIQAIRLEADAARARAAFLRQLGEGEGVAALDTAALRDLLGMIGEETLTALQTAHEAERRADLAARDLKDIEEELEQARQALRALVPEDEERALLAVTITSPEPTSGRLVITYNTYDSLWLPVYDLKLDRADEVLTFERGAFVAQGTGENWINVALTLSTVRPTERIAPWEVGPHLRRIYDPEEEARARARAVAETDAMLGAVGGAMEEPYIAPAVEAAMSADFDGLAVTYTYPQPVSLASGADYLRLALDTLETDVEIKARAVPLNEDVAYLTAELTNDMNELILPTHLANFYLDGRFMGQSHLEMIPAGADADIAFGPIDGLRLTRTVLNRNEGDRGMLSRSTEQVEEVRIEIENLTGTGWDVDLIDRVPYSEQEDLEITWSADPMPDEQDIDGKRGVMEWELYVGADETSTVTLSHQMEWPEGQALR
ncbi:mucoidy inhibitor MuiA family protein [Roseovarius faecimaris]|uniref:Mucoidy inhibitor MuiA family protein n=2 Tax=Roseovarius faecimaris TaxID=2494550 RepID=A0A6I6ISQ9_9RHOB|nr:mucoidy inhibitor MuiA family protein [Roseovarius faecimaris]